MFGEFHNFYQFNKGKMSFKKITESYIGLEHRKFLNKSSNHSSKVFDIIDEFPLTSPINILIKTVENSQICSAKFLKAQRLFSTIT